MWVRVHACMCHTRRQTVKQSRHMRVRVRRRVLTTGSRWCSGIAWRLAGRHVTHGTCVQGPGTTTQRAASTTHTHTHTHIHTHLHSSGILDTSDIHTNDPKRNACVRARARRDKHDAHTFMRACQ